MAEQQHADGEHRVVKRRAGAWRIAVVLLAIIVALLLYSRVGMWSSPEQWQASGAGFFTTAFVIILIMSASLACGLTASYFLILTPLLFPLHWSAAITTTGSVLG